MSQRALLVTRQSRFERALRRYNDQRGWQVVTAADLSQARSLLDQDGASLVFLDASLWARKWAEKSTSLARDYPDCRFVVIVETDGRKAKLNGAPGNLEVHTIRPPRPDEGRTLDDGSKRTVQGAPSKQKKQGWSAELRLPIRVKITIPYVLLAFLLAVGAGVMAVRLVFDTVEERYTNQLIEAGRLANEWMVIEEDRLLETARAIARTQGTAFAVSQGDRERLRLISLPIAVNAGEEAVEFVTADGENLLSMRRRPDDPREKYEFSTGSELAGYTFVQQAIAGEADQRGDKRAGFMNARWGHYFYVAAPIYGDNEEVVGAVLVGTSVDSLVRGMRQATLAQITLYSTNGDFLASTFLAPQRLGQGSFEVSGELGPNSYTRSLSVANIDYREIVGPWEVRGSQRIGLLGSALPESFLVLANRWTLLQIAGMVVVAFVLVISVGYLVSNHITEPLLQLVRASREVAQGNLGVQLQPRGNDEVGSLASTFNQMVSSLRNSRFEMLNAYDSTLEGWSKALELRDNDTQGHTRRVVEMSMKLGKAMDLDPDQLMHLRRGAILHDIGKMGIPDGILRKPAPLDQTEWKTMREHPVFAYEMLAHIDYLRPALAVPLHHHEWWDGSGYPDGLKGEEIPLSARIFAVADVCDALLSDRPYRSAWSVERTVEYIRSLRGRQFDPTVVDTFVRMVEQRELVLKRYTYEGNGQPHHPTEVSAG